jgi:hypothetical protein
MYNIWSYLPSVYRVLRRPTPSVQREFRTTTRPKTSFSIVRTAAPTQALALSGNSVHPLSWPSETQIRLHCTNPEIQVASHYYRGKSSKRTSPRPSLLSLNHSGQSPDDSPSRKFSKKGKKKSSSLPPRDDL